MIVCGGVARQLAGGQGKCSSPAKLDDDVLLTGGRICHGRRDDARVRLRRPQALAVIRLEGCELSCRHPLEHEISRRGDHAPVPRLIQRNLPQRPLPLRVPGEQAALQAALDPGDDLRVFGQAAGVEVDPRIPTDVARFEVLIPDVDEPHVVRRDVHDLRHGVVRHRHPVVAAARPGKRGPGFAGLPVTRLRILARPPGLRIQPRRPVHSRVGFA